MGRLQGKAAIVVGAGSIAPGWGNGKAAAVAFAREGAKVLVVDACEDAAQATHEVIRGEGGASEAFTADATRDGDMAAMVRRCVERFGGLQVLHNNVGVMTPGDLCELSEEDWDRTVTVNLKGLFLACRHALPVMVRAGGGAIVNVGSISAERYLGMPAIAYSTSKGGVAAFTRALAAQYGPQQVRVNLLVPGIVDTPVLASVADRIAAATGQVAGPQARRRREQTVPMGRFGSAWDVAMAAVYLASDEAAYVNGAELVVDGGLACMAPQPQRSAAGAG
ncbi:SDR family NAD(P)-dependent oxidoreductase [Aquabacterium sp. J223]|uniref:SDR family NAD(P)-dependent oxidoreductase n=1 Tax=Aquabacterium sp. J223 TaxID=2898431 RepID=UPI0021AD5EED|nr:SDR family NAD(P)-dependent oxidoreductase [Aquabacterium sp. J223]UUX95316.1 SDR family oxidoreductase [Aquabacterium sp. J223]